MVYMITNYPLPQLRAFFYPISTYTEGSNTLSCRITAKRRTSKNSHIWRGYNTTTFRRLFRSLYGVPRLRMDAGEKTEGILEDLQHSNMRITEICNRYGFDSLSHLTLLQRLLQEHPARLRRKRKNRKITIKELFL